MKHTYGGYLTVEAALIVPIAFFCFLYIIFLGIYQYDRCSLQQDAMMLLLRTSNITYYTNQEIYNEAYDNGFYLNKSEYPFFSWIENRLEVGTDKISVSVMGKVSTFFGGLLFSAPATKMWSIQMEGEIEKYDPEAFIRTYRNAVKLTKQEET